MRINSTQMDVTTQFAPLNELFEIVPVDGAPLSQWCYRGTEDVWRPDRTTNPLLLRPTIEATDPETRQRYDIDIAHSTVLWYVREGDGEETQITNTIEGADKPYTVLTNGDLVVRKNVPLNSAGNAAVTLRCVVVYNDPRGGDSVTTENSVVLTTNLDASPLFDVQILTPKVIDFDPFTEWESDDPDEHPSYKTLTAKVFLAGEEVADNSVTVEWYAMDKANNGTELLINNNNLPFLSYVSGQNTRTLVVDAKYANNLTIIARVRRVLDNVLLNCRDTVSVIWKIPSIDSDVVCPEGSMARRETTEMNFSTIYNAHGIGSLSETDIARHFAIKWQKRNSAGSYMFLQWGRGVKLTGDEVRTTNKTSTLVEAQTYLKGEYRPLVVSDSDDTVLVLDSDPTNIIVEREI